MLAYFLVPCCQLKAVCFSLQRHLSGHCLLCFSAKSYHPKWDPRLTLICPRLCKLSFPRASHYPLMGPWLPQLCPRFQNSIQQTWCPRHMKQLHPSMARHPWQDTVQLRLESSKTQMVSKQLDTPADPSIGRIRGFQHEEVRCPLKVISLSTDIG